MQLYIPLEKIWLFMAAMSFCKMGIDFKCAQDYKLLVAGVGVWWSQYSSTACRGCEGV